MSLISVLLFALLHFAFSAIYYSISFANTEVGRVTGLPLPRYVSLKSNEINLRAGPGLQYPIRYTYKCQGYPMSVIAEFEHWRLVKDITNAEGWIHKSLVASKRNVMIQNNYVTAQLPYKTYNKEALLFTWPDENSYPAARVEFGMVATLGRCIKSWCYVTVDKKYSGWIRDINLYGINKDASLDAGE